MKTAQILHGMLDAEEYFSDEYPSPSNSHWLPWLQKEFLKAGYLAQTPELPKPYEPDYNAWTSVFEQNPPGPETILVGHSCGGGFLLRWLSENKITAARTVLVAPYLDPARKETGEFFNFKIDPDLCGRTDLHILHSDNDMQSICTSVDLIRAALPKLTYHPFQNYGHFCMADMKIAAFPELLEIALDENPFASFAEWSSQADEDGYKLL